MTKVEIVKKAILGVMNQGQACVVKGMCVYKTSDGDKQLKCAVGHLIDDEHYNLEFDDDGMTIYDYPVIKAVELSNSIEVDKELAVTLRQLQNAHDSVSSETRDEQLKEEFLYHIEKFCIGNHIVHTALRELGYESAL